MHRIAVVSLAILCWVGGSSAQTCNGCRTSCSGENGDARCCLWDYPPVETDPASYTDPSRTPLGFTTAFLPRVESDAPKPCVVANIDSPSSQTYIQVAVESTVDVCVYPEGKEEDQSCGTEVLFCAPDGYKGASSVTFQFDCTSCPAADTSFFFRINMETRDAVDEYWCDDASANVTLPRDLIQNENTAFTPSDISHMTVPASAPHLLVTPALLVISLLIAALSI